MEHKPILGYWKIRGLASGLRYQLVYSGVDFTEEQYAAGEAPDFDRSSWMNVKFEQGLDFPNLPYLKDGDYLMTETKAIHSYIAAKWCPALLCLDDVKAHGNAEMMWGIVHDVKMFSTMECYRSEEGKEALAEKVLAKWEEKGLAKWMHGKTYIAGDKLSFTDFSLAEVIEQHAWITDGKLYEVHPHVKEYRDRIFNLPKLKEYFESEQCMKRPFNNTMARINN